MNERPIRMLPVWKALLVAAGSTATLLPGLAGCRGKASPADVSGPPKPVATVTAVVAKQVNVPLVVERPATTRSLNETTVRARVRGFLKGVHFKEGTDVKEGDLLLVIDETSFRVKVDLAKANLAEAEAALQQALQSKAKEVAAAQVKLAETQLGLDEVEERRSRTLFARKAASPEDLDRAVATRAKSAAAVESEKAAREQKVADYETSILSARAKVEQAKSELRNAEIDLGYCRMTALISGRAGELIVKPGNLVGSATGNDQALVSIQQLDPMGVDLNPPARFLPVVARLVKQGLPIEVAAPREGGPGVYRGKVVFIDNKVEPTTSTFLLRAEVANPEETLLPGEFVKVTLNLGEYVDVFLVPERSVVERQEGTIVLVADEQGKVAARPVKVVGVHEGFRVVQSGLEPGMKVIADGVQLARPGETVRAEVVDLETFRRVETTDGETGRYDSGVIRYKGEDAEKRPIPTADPAPTPASAPEARSAPKL